MSRTHLGHPDNDPPSDLATPGAESTAELSHVFGFDLPEDEWVNRVHGAVTEPGGESRLESAREHRGKRIGPYELLEQVGSGGMGTVWRARRADKCPDRVVAIKLIRAGMDSRSALRRFRLEEQVLARLEHPNIARLYDGGATAGGLPYLVMEYVEGKPIDEFARRHDLTVEQRLSLFGQICSAVQYAHAALVLHRDIKPSNIIVGTDGVPRLLDFGIAKILDDAADNAANMTATDARVLTPRFASPEQFRGERLTVATDVYSLGVILYELLTDGSPYDTPSGTRRELERAILEQEPSKPSAAVRNLDSLPIGKRRTLSRRLRGELDAICAMTLQKNPSQRYRSVQELGEDVRRHLQGLPPLARPPGPVAKLVRIARRKRGAIITASVGVALGIALAAFYVVQAFMVPHWQEEHVRRARLSLAGGRVDNPFSNNAFYNILLLNGKDWSPEELKSGSENDATSIAREEYMAAMWLADDPRVASELAMLDLGDRIRNASDQVESILTSLPGETPMTDRYVRGIVENRANPSFTREEFVDASTLDLRSLGLVAWHLGDLNSTINALTRLPLIEPDPIVEALLGNIYLALDEPELAYPRLLSAFRSYPESASLATYLADAAARCGDIDQARFLLDLAGEEQLSDVHYPGHRVRMLMLLKQGDEDAATELYCRVGLSPGNVVAVLQMAHYIEERGDIEGAIRTLAGRITPGRVEHASRDYFARLMEALWVEYDDQLRAALESSENHDDPIPQEEFDMFLRRYRVAVIKSNSQFGEGHPLYLRSGWATLSRPLEMDASDAAREQLLSMSGHLPPADLPPFRSEQCGKGSIHFDFGK